MSLGDEKFTRTKNRRKRVRTVMEILIIAFIGFLIINAFYTLKKYKPYQELQVATGNTDTGFIALSYFGVDRAGNTASLIGEKQLREHLKVLSEQGYVTITQQDILNYYRQGKPLPKRALFLMFEDGRRDTAIFAQPILEDLNYKASMMTYPEKFPRQDPTFLSPADLKELTASSFWEMGTNGYRLQYINVFDRYGNYLGEIDPLKYAGMRKGLGRRYNHYLMDYLRDKDGKPKESARHMMSRMNYDYDRVRDVYSKELGYVPGLYVLMHSNTGRFGNNPEASALNERRMRELFKMNFNREGFCLNRRNSSLYDLTRMQPQPYWPKNHLLMRIKYDINEPVKFVRGDKEKQKAWELIEGASEAVLDYYTLTSLPEKSGIVRLRGSEGFRNIRTEVSLCGNSFGGQFVYLRTSPDLSQYVAVGVENGMLVVKEKTGAAEKELYRERLAVIYGDRIPSVEEDRREVEAVELETFARYAYSKDMALEYLTKANERRKKPAASVTDGAKPYYGLESFHARNKCRLRINLRDDRLAVLVNEKLAAGEIRLTRQEAGSLCLFAGWNQKGWSQRNLADDVYDGVFERLIVKENRLLDAAKEKVLYSMELKEWEKFRHDIMLRWDKLIDWFIKYL